MTPDGASLRARIRGRWRGWRNRRIADPAFQRWAARFPPTRPLARTRAEDLYDIVCGFVYSQVLLACVELGIFDHLETAPIAFDDLAARVGLAPDRAERLVQAATALGLLERDGAGVGLGPTGAALIGAPGVVEMVRHHALFYRDLADPVTLLRDGSDTELRAFWGYVGGATTHAMPPEAAARYSSLMAASQGMVADETLAAVSLPAEGRILDVGGGDGAFLEAALTVRPGLHGILFDLPAVADRAQARFSRNHLAARTTCIGGSFLDDPLPGDADVAALIRVLYDHDDATVSALLGKVAAVLPAGGLLVLSEPMSGGARPSRSGDAYFGFYTLAMGSGRPRSVERHVELLAAAGFGQFRHHDARQRFVTSVITARRI